MKRNLFALLILLLILVAFPALIFGARHAQGFREGTRVIEVRALAPDAGGFVPDRLTLTAGEKVTLRFTAPDVVHGLIIPELGINIDEIYPGKPVEVTVQPDEPGRYEFACTRWCGLDHWRMRGVIEVVGQDGDRAIPQAEKPLFEQLGIDIDAMRHAPAALPAARPAVARGAAVAGETGGAPAWLASTDERRKKSPSEAFAALRVDEQHAGLSDDEIWDLIAWAWLKDVPADAMRSASELYARDCAACHGETGRGDGVAGKDLPGMAKMDPAMPWGPADFTDPGHMLSASDALLHGKLLRGGMGTGMPEFGSLYTDQELWAMVSYLRTYLFSK
jgi:mono/diheme cytochrome c family protein/plastocyanin